MKQLMVMVAALAMVTGSAYGADWNFYGSARITTFYTQTETIDSGASNDNQYEQKLQSNSRIGAKVKVNDELTARFEYGASKGNANIRLLYGAWNFGGGTLVIGQDYSPLNWFHSHQAFDSDASLYRYGGVYSGRAAQLKLKFGGFQVALIPASNSVTGVTPTSVETKLPAIEASYVFKLDKIALKLGGGYQTFESGLGGGNEETISSYVLAVGAKGTFGNFYTAAHIYGGRNGGNLISMDTNGSRTWSAQGIANLTPTQVQDNDVLGGVIVAGWVLNDMFTFEAGYGYAREELDIDGSTKDEVLSYYLQSSIVLAPGVLIVPEIGRLNAKESGQTDITYGGIKWQINF